MPLYCHNPPKPEVCEVCRRYCTDDWFRAAVDKSADGVRKRRIQEKFPLKLCRHLGLPTGETLPCPACNQVVPVPVQECAVHKECTVDRLVAGKKCCKVCPDFVPEA